MTNFQKEKKIENKVQKLTNFTEKKDVWGQTNKLGLSLRRKKKGFFGAKIVEKIEYIGQKRTFWARKNKPGLSLRRKKGFLGPKIGKKWV